VKTRYFYYDNGKYGMGQEDVPPLRDDQFLVRTTVTQVSVGTETAMNTGRARVKVGRHGYSLVGRVVRVGPKVKDVRPGDRIVCFKNHGDYAVLTTGGTEWEAYYHVPEGVSDEAATFLALGLVSLYVVERAQVGFGHTVVVVGLGTVGQMAAQLARLSGAGCVIGVDLQRRKCELARRLGADAAIEPDGGALARALEGSLDGAPAATFVDVSGSSKAVEWILAHAERASRIVIAGAYCEPISFDPSLIVRGELELVGAFQPACPDRPAANIPYNRQLNARLILRLLQRGELRVEQLYDAVLSPEEVIAFYDACLSGDRRPFQPLICWWDGRTDANEES